MPDREMRFIVTAETQRYRRELQKAQEENRKLRAELAKTNQAEQEGAAASEERADALKDSTSETRKARTEERAHRTDMGRSTESLKRLTDQQRAYNETLIKLRIAQRDVASAETERDRVMKSATSSVDDRDRAELALLKTLGAVSRAQKTLTGQQKEYERDNDSIQRTLAGTARALAQVGGSGGKAGGIFNALGGAMGAARAEAKNFGLVMKLGMGIPLAVGAVHALIGAVSSLAAGLAALIPNLVQASAVLAGLPGLIFGVVQAAGVGALAFTGIGDAVKALADRQASAKESAQEQAQAQEGLADAQKAAAEAISAAEENVADAHDAVREAQERLTEAREDAREALEDLRFEVEQASISEERAQISVIEARRALQEMLKEGGTDIELREARLDLREAELGVKQARDQSKDSQEDLREAEKKGISNSDQVVAAQEALADATEASADAQEALNETMESSAEAVAAAREDLTGMTSEQEKLKEAFRALTPEARAFAKQLFAMRPLLDALRATAQRGVLPGASDALARLTTLFPVLETAVGNTGVVLGDFFRRIAARITTPEWLRDLPLLFEQSDYVIGRAGEALADLLDIFRDFMIAARPVTIWLADTVGGWIEYVRAATEAGRESGRLTAFLEDAIVVAEQLGRILGDTFVALFNVFRQGADVGQDFWDQIERGAQTFRDWTESIEGENAIQKWFEDAKPAIEAAVRLLGAIGKALLDIASDSTGGLAGLFDTVTTRLIPAFVSLGDSVSEELLPAFVELVSQIIEFFSVIGGQGGTWAVFLQTLGFVAEVINKIIQIPFVKWALGIVFAIQGVVSAMKFLGRFVQASFIGKFLDAESAIVTKVIPALGRLLILLKGVVAVTKAQGLAAGFQSLGAVVGGAAQGVTALASGLGTLAKVIPFVGAAYLGWTLGMRAANGEIAASVSQMKENVDFLIKNREAGESFNDVVEESVDAIPRWDDEIAIFTSGIEAFTDQFERGTITTEEFGIAMDRFMVTDDPQERAERLAAAMKVLDERVRSESLTLPEYEAGLNGLGLEADDVAAQVAKVSHELDVLAVNDALGEWQNNNEKALSGFKKLTGQTFDSFKEQATQAFDVGGIEGLQTFVGEQITQLEDLRDAYRENFDAVGEAYADLSGEAEVSSDEIYASFQKQLSVVEEYDENWRILEKRGTPKKVLDQLREMGLDGAAIVEGLANSSEGDFDRTIAKMLETEEASKDLADNVNEKLAKSIDRLIRVLKALRDLPEIILGIDVDTSGVEDKVTRLIRSMEEKGFTLTESVTAARGRGFGGVGASAVFGHTGGAVPGGLTEGPAGSPKSNEVDARLLVGEYVFSREAVKRAGGMQQIDRIHRALRGGLNPMDPGQIDPHTGEPLRGGFRSRKSGRKRFHDGGGVFAGGVEIDQRFMDAGFALPALYRDIGTNEISGQVFAKLKPTGWEIAFDDGNTKGTGTPGMNALNNWIHKHFNVNGTNTVAGPNRFINFNAANGLSQHAFGNAGDYTGQFGSMNALFHGIVRAAESRMIRTLGHAIFNRQAWSYNEQNIGPYTGSIPHTDHAHIDALPQYAGPWPGHPVPPAQYHDGGIVKRSGMVHPGELVFDSQVTDNFVKALTRGGGFLAPLPSISAAQTRSSLVDDSPGSEPNGGQGTTMEVALDVDGVRMSRVVELHSRRNKVLLPSRSRR